MAEKGKGSKNAGTDIRRCSCTQTKDGRRNGAEFQDETHGPGMRVHNQCNKGWRCTVCGKENS